MLNEVELSNLCLLWFGKPGTRLSASPYASHQWPKGSTDLQYKLVDGMTVRVRTNIAGFELRDLETDYLGAKVESFEHTDRIFMDRATRGKVWEAVRITLPNGRWILVRKLMRRFGPPGKS